jgi:hypothetical protein
MWQNSNRMNDLQLQKQRLGTKRLDKILTTRQQFSFQVSDSRWDWPSFWSDVKQQQILRAVWACFTPHREPIGKSGIYV